MAEQRNFAHRAYVEDVRKDGKYLRATWHPELPGFIVSNWDGQVCVGATRVAVEDAPRLISLLANGLADAAAESQAGPDVVTPVANSRSSRLLEHASQARTRITRMLRQHRRSTDPDPVAEVVDLSQHRDRHDDEPRWMFPPQR